MVTLQQPLSYRLETFTDDKDAIKANYLLLHSSLFFSFGRWIMDRRLVLSLRLGILGFRDRKWTPSYIKVVHYSCLKVFVRALCAKSTVWKFQDFCITQFIREINFEHSRSAKTAIFALLRAVNFVQLVSFSFQKVQKFIKNQNLESLNVLKWLV